MVKSRRGLGGLYEVETSKGLAYLQFAFWSELLGEVIRVFKGFHESRPTDLAEILSQPVAFTIAYPVGSAERSNLITRVGDAEVPGQFPVMRAGAGWLWDGEREWRVPEFSEAERSLPRRLILNHQALVDAITYETEDRDFSDAGANTKLPPEQPDERAGRKSESVQHYLYFSSNRHAVKALGKAESRGYVGAISEADQDGWLLKIRGSGDPDADRKSLERIASSVGGEYDGWEARLG